MYERSAIVLERYIEKILNLDKPYNTKKNGENYKGLLEELETYQIVVKKESEMINEFDSTAKRIQQLQQMQEKLHKANQKLEDDRNKLFTDLGENVKTLDAKFQKIEDALDNNNEQLKKIRDEFVQCLSEFAQKQKERNKCEKEKRTSEAKHREYIKKVSEEFKGIDTKDIIILKDFINAEKDGVRDKALEVMTKNGKNERVAFNQDVLKKAIDARINVAEKEAECYILLYDKMKRILLEVENEFIKLDKYKKALRNTSVKLAFLRAEKEYICSFLDYERMTAIGGAKVHKKKMEEACNNFELDMIQIKNLYELIIREITNKSTKKAYNELYNKTYLKNIKDKEKNFEEEVNQVNIRTGTLINSNYWRIEGIKNIYTVFKEEVSEKFEKDLSEYSIEEQEEFEDEEEYYEEDYDDKEDDEEYYEKDDYDDEEDDEEYYEEDDYDDEEDEEEYYEEDDYDDEEDDEEYYEDEDYEDEEDSEEYDEDEDYDDKNDLEETDKYKKENKRKQKNSNKKKNQKIESFEDEDNIDEIIEKSRKKGLLNKFFKN